MIVKTKKNCPGCGNEITILASEMIPGKSKVCTICGSSFLFKGDDGRVLQSSIDKLMNQIKRM